LNSHITLVNYQSENEQTDPVTKAKKLKVDLGVVNTAPAQPRAEHQTVIFINLLMHFVPTVCWGATGVTVIAPMLWSIAGAGFVVFVNRRNKSYDRLREYLFMTGWRPAIIADVALRGLLFSVALNLVCYFAGLIVARSGGVTRAVESLLIAYCMAGLYHALCSLPRATTHAFTYVESALEWLPVSMITLRQPDRRMFSHAFLCCAFFATSAGVLFSI
jgi:hypothetical protein